MPTENIILKLRPKSGASTDIATSITLAETAASEQQAAITGAKNARDDALLDAEPATLRKAEQVLADAREQGERISAVLNNLRQRHATAVESETVARVKSLLAEFQASDQALSAWWLKMRVKLAAELTAGLELLNITNDARSEHDRAAAAAAERYPHQTFAQPTLSPVYAYSWPHDLQSSATMADVYPDSFNSLLTAGDPKQPGAF